MDNFMDKLAQKFNAEELMKANKHAETVQMEQLQLQVAEYEKLLQEMRKLNYKNMELSERMETVIGENADKIANLQVDQFKTLDLLRTLVDDQANNIKEEARRDEQNREQKLLDDQEAAMKARQNLDSLEELLKKSDEFAHKENVKVYRNVQAVIIEELKKQTEEIAAMSKKTKSRLTLVTILSVLTFLLAALGVATQILLELNLLVF